MIPTPVPTPSLDPLNSPLGRLILHPGPTVLAFLGRLWDLVTPWLLPAAASVVFILAAVIGGKALLQRRRTKLLADGARWMSILLPPEVDPAGAETLWLNLVELLRPPWRRLIDGQPHLSFEYLWSTEGLRIGIWVPGPVAPDLVESAIEAAWPGAQTELSQPRAPLGDSKTILGGELRLAVAEWFPIRITHAADPLRALLGAAAVRRQGDFAAVQVLARPVTSGRWSACHKAARTLRTGESFSLINKLLDFIQPGPPVKPTTLADDPTRAPDIRTILDKASGPGWEMVVRYAVGTQEEGREARKRLRGRAHAIASAFGIFSGRNRLARHHLRGPVKASQSRCLGKANLVSIPELAGLAHLPTDLSIPGITRAGARPAVPPTSIADKGKVIGDSDAGPRHPIALSPADAAFHLHVLGATGSGKSTLLTNLVLDDVKAGRGAVVIDPKGDLVIDILDRLPKESAGKVVLIDPEDDAPPTMNVLAGADPGLVVDHLVGIFHNIFLAHWGPRTDDVLRAACLTLLSDPEGNATLADVPLLLSNAVFRGRLTAGMDDKESLGGFWEWYDSMSEAQKSQVVGPVMNKLRAFLMRGFVRKLIGHPESSFDMTEDVLDGGLLLVRIPKGIVGDETAKLLGSLVVARVWQAATARARAGKEARVDASLYIDECQNFLNLPRSFEEMLAEARGYKLSLVLAHQHLAQLPRDLREGISANARNKIFFNMSPEDAHVLSRHTGPMLDEHDLSHLGGYQVAARLVVAGADKPAFTLRTRQAPEVVPGRADIIRKESAARFGGGAGNLAAIEAKGRSLDPKLARAAGRRMAPQSADHSTNQSADHSTDQP